MNFKRDVIGIPEDKSIGEVFCEKSLLSRIFSLIAVLLTIYILLTSLVGTPQDILHKGIFLFTILILVFLKSSVEKPGKGYLAVNIILSLLALGVMLYICYDFDMMHSRSEEPENLDLFLSALTLLLVMEACRRSVGWPMVGLIGFFLLYTRFGGYVPGSFGHAGFSWTEILDLQYLTYNGVFTTPLGVMSTFIVIFLIFAGILMKSNAVYAFMDLATRLLGHTIGGPAKAAIIASTFMGSVSGSAAANTMVTGFISIPLMKKLGYKPHFAGAVEASVSSGGQFMPPIMGASAFVIASVLGIPYIRICLHALFPAIFWFFCFFITLHFEAQRLQLKPIPKDELPAWGPVLKQQYFFIPIFFLVYFLMIGYSPFKAGFITVAILFALTFINKGTRFTVVSFIAAMEYGMNSAIAITAACAGAGIIVGCVMQSGVGYYLSAALVSISGGSLAILLILCLIASLIMGMGMVTVGAYIIVSILVSPALIEMGVTPIGAHLYPFYFAIISAITPPVAVASYAGAAIADANPWDTGVEGMRLAIPALAIPFIFVTQPGLLFIGGFFDISIVVIKTFFGVSALAAAVIGFQFRNLSALERLLQAVAAILLFCKFGWIPAVGLAILLVSVYIQKSSIKTASAAG